MSVIPGCEVAWEIMISTRRCISAGESGVTVSMGQNSQESVVVEEVVGE